MKLRKIRKGIVFVMAAGALGLGCELIVDFDRTKIPVEGADATTPVVDGSVDATLDTFQPDTSTPPVDAGPDTADAADAADGD